MKNLVLNDRAEFTMNCCVTNVKVRESLTPEHRKLSDEGSHSPQKHKDCGRVSKNVKKPGLLPRIIYLYM